MSKKLFNEETTEVKKKPELIVTLVGNYTNEIDDHRVFEMKYDVNNQKVVDFQEFKCDNRYDIITQLKIRAAENNLV